MTTTIRRPSIRQRDVRRLLLVFPPSRITREGLKFCLMPLGVSYLAAAARKHMDVDVLDATAEGYHHEEDDDRGFFRFGLSLPDIRARIEASRPDMVGVGCLYSPMWPVVRDIVRVAKSVDPDIVTVAGGNHPTFLPERCLSEPGSEHLDYIVLGEGEETLVELARRLTAGEGVADVDGLAYRDGSGAVHVTPKTRQILDVDTIPFPARDMMPLATYARINLPHMVISRRRNNTSLFTSRGCPAKCTFCSSAEYWSPGKRYRRRSDENIIAEIEEVVSRYGITEFNMEDDSFTAHPKQVKVLLRKIIDRKLDITWNAPNGIAMWTLDDELLDLMVASGLQEMVLPFESGDQETLKELVNKPLKLSKAEEVVKAVKARGIRHNSFFIIGFPGQTRAAIDRTLEYIRRMDLDATHLFAAHPLPGTVMAQECLDKGYISPDYDYTETFFTKGSITTDEFTAEEITRIVQTFFVQNNWRLLFKSPVRFVGRYGALLKNPLAFRELVTRNLRRVARRLALAPQPST